MTVRQGRGIEISVEALVLILSQRFPNLVAWGAMPSMPSVEYTANTGMVGLYWTWDGTRHPVEWGDDSVNPVRRVVEQGAIPVTQIVTPHLVKKGTVLPRCGQRLTDYDQCTRKLGHKKDHRFESEGKHSGGE